MPVPLSVIFVRHRNASALAILTFVQDLLVDSVASTVDWRRRFKRIWGRRVPVSAILLGTLVPGETLAPRHFAGMALIGVGLLAFDGLVWRWVRGKRAVEAA